MVLSVRMVLSVSMVYLYAWFYLYFNLFLLQRSVFFRQRMASECL
jgi:hypothetical protein